MHEPNLPGHGREGQLFEKSLNIQRVIFSPAESHRIALQSAYPSFFILPSWGANCQSNGGFHPRCDVQLVQPNVKKKKVGKRLKVEVSQFVAPSSPWFVLCCVVRSTGGRPPSEFSSEDSLLQRLGQVDGVTLGSTWKKPVEVITRPPKAWCFTSHDCNSCKSQWLGLRVSCDSGQIRL